MEFGKRRPDAPSPSRILRLVAPRIRMSHRELALATRILAARAAEPPRPWTPGLIAAAAAARVLGAGRVWEIGRAFCVSPVSVERAALALASNSIR